MRRRANRARPTDTACLVLAFAPVAVRGEGAPQCADDASFKLQARQDYHTFLGSGRSPHSGALVCRDSTVSGGAG